MHYDIKDLIATFNAGKKFDKDQKQYIKKNHNIIFYRLCTSGQFNMLNWLYNFLEGNDIDICIDNNYSGVFSNCCRCGYTNIIDFIYDLSKRTGNNKININNNYNEAFRSSCEYGHKETAEYLYNLSKIDGNNKINPSTCDNYSFRKSCENGHKDVAQYLYNLSKNDDNQKIDINTRNNYAFKKSCENGHTETVIWLYSLSQIDNNVKININSDYIDIFIQCCHRDYKEVAEWLYHHLNMEGNEFNIDNNLFKKCCEKNCKKIIEWFCVTNPKYSFKIKDNHIIYKIKDTKETITRICGKNIYNRKFRLYKMFKKAEVCKADDTTCPICLSENELYQIRLPCYHTLCVFCFGYADEDYNKCHYRCNEPIDYDNVKLIKLKKSTQPKHKIHNIFIKN